MSYQWLEEDLTCDRLSQTLGCKVKNIISGQVIIGEKDVLDGEGNPIRYQLLNQALRLSLSKNLHWSK